MTTGRWGIAVLAGCVALGGTASAGVVTVIYVGGVGAQVSLDGGSSYAKAKAGATRVSGLQGAGSLPLGDFHAFAVDLEKSVTGATGATLGSMADWGSSGASTQQKQRASYLAGKFVQAYPAAPPSTAVMGAYQLAIWELLYETGGTYALGSGSARFKTGTSAAKKLAAQLIAESAGHGGTFASWLETSAGSRPRPDLIAGVTPPTVVSVPETLPTLAGLAMALLALVAVRRRVIA